MFPTRPIVLRSGLRPTLPRTPFRSSKPKATRNATSSGLNAAGRLSAIGAPISLPPAPVTGLLAAGVGAAGMTGILAFAGAAVT